MSIRRQDLDQMDFSDVTTGEILPPVHPGEILLEEFLKPLNMSGHALALALRVPAPRIHDILNKKRGITPDTALRLSRYFGTSAELWMNLQVGYDLTLAKHKLADILVKDITPRAA